MSRKVRKVPEGWEHPRYAAESAPHPSLVGQYRPQFEQTHSQRVAEDPEAEEEDPANCRDEALAGGDHFQLYEDTTEGTPISPVFRSREDLLHHLETQGDDRGKIWPERAIAKLRDDGYLVTSQTWQYGV